MELLLIDLSHLFWTAWHASVNDEVSTARNNTVNRVRGIIGRYPKAAICCDSATSWRKKEHPAYKANRPVKDHAAVEELRQVEEILRKDGCVMWKCETFEADDVIATATKHAVARGWDVVIFTCDKDLCQLVGPKVRILSARSGEFMGAEEVKQKHAVAPSQMLDYLALVGDKSDNIDGVRGVGEKTASALLERFGSIDGIYTALDETPELFTKPAIKSALLESTKIVELAQKLIALRDDVPIKFEEIDEERKPEPLQEGVDVSDIDDGDAEIDEVPAMAEFQPPRTLPVTEERRPPQTAPTPVRETALATTQEAPLTRATFEMSLEPTTIGAAYKLAKGLVESRLYSRFPNAEAIWAVIIRGREMGLGALTALDAFHVVEGKPYAHANLLIAKAKADPDCEYFYCVESDEKHCIMETKHRRAPKPERFEFTIEMAKMAGLVKPGSNWEKRPGDMLFKTTGSKLARRVYPGVAFLYSIEEIGMEEAA